MQLPSLHLRHVTEYWYAGSGATDMHAHEPIRGEVLLSDGGVGFHKPKLSQVPLPLSLHRICPRCGRACDQSRVDEFSMQISGRCYICAHPQQKVAPTIRRH